MAFANAAKRSIDDATAAAALRRRLDERLAGVSRPRTPSTVFRAESRRDRRSAAYRIGAAIFEPGHLGSCRVVDQSRSGLRLEFYADGACPDEFALQIPTLQFIGVVRKSWQEGRFIGVSILRWCDAASAG